MMYRLSEFVMSLSQFLFNLSHWLYCDGTQLTQTHYECWMCADDV